jgi:hypothetical protein
VDVDRLDRVAAGKVDAVEILGELHQVAEGFAISDPAPTVQIHRIRRA